MCFFLKKKKKKGKKEIATPPMVNALVIAFILLSAIQFVGQGYIFGIVHLNYVATWSELPLSNVPYYDSSNIFANAVARYSLDWWLLFFDFFDIVIPGIVFLCYLIALKGSTNFIWILWGYLVFSGVLNLRIFWRIIQLGTCGTIGNICESTDPSRFTGAFNTKNLLFISLITYNGLFVLWIILYGYMSSKIPAQIEIDREEMLKKRLKLKGLTLSEIEILNTNALVGLFAIENGRQYKEQVPPALNKPASGPYFPSTTPSMSPAANTSTQRGKLEVGENISSFNSMLNKTFEPRDIVRNSGKIFFDPSKIQKGLTRLTSTFVTDSKKNE